MRIQSVPFLSSTLLNFGSLASAAIDTLHELPCKGCPTIPTPLCPPEEKCCSVITCKGVLPACCTATNNSFSKNGLTTNEYRRSNKKCLASPVELNECIELCTKQSHCRTLSFEKFFDAVLETARCISKGKVTCFGPHQKKIIQNIYNAGIKTHATCEQLIIFTATAMHNCYLFSYFPESGMNTSIGAISRGLMQWLSREGYANLTKVSEINYLQKPYLVELYNSETVHNEFEAYLKFYNKSSLCGVNAYIYTIKAFASREAYLATDAVAYEILIGAYKPTNVLEEKIQRRFNLYYSLTARIFNHKRKNF